MPLLNAADALFLGSSAVDRVYLDSSIVWPPAYAQWSTVNKHAQITLSNNDRTAVVTAVGNRSVLGVAPILKKVYWEIEITSLSNNVLLGVASEGSRTNTTTITSTTGFSYNSNGTGASPLNVSYTATDRIGFAFDPATGNLWVRKNGTWLGSSPSGAPATTIPGPASGRVFVPYAASTGNMNITLMSDPVTFDNAAPSGFAPLVNDDFPGYAWSTTDKILSAILSDTRSKITKFSTGHANVCMGTDVCKGKQVFAIKVTADGAGTTAKSIGLLDIDDSRSALIGGNGFGVGYRTNGQVLRNSLLLQAYTAWGAVNDIVMVAVDVPNSLLWFGLNGTWNGSPSAGTGSVGGFPTDGSLNYVWLAAGSTDAGDAFQFITWPYAVPTGFTAPAPLAAEFVTYRASFDGFATNATFSNANLTATHSNTTGNSGAGSSASKRSGKWYFEITITQSTGANDSCGALNNLGTLTNLAAATPTNCINVVRSTGNIFSNNVSSGKSLGALANGDVVCWAIDLDNNLAWARKNGGNWNGDGSANPATGAVGVSSSGFSGNPFTPVVGFSGTGTASGDNMTGNFGGTAFTQSVPSGFNSGWTR